MEKQKVSAQKWEVSRRNRRYQGEPSGNLEAKNTITEIIYSLDRLNGRMERIEKTASKPEDRQTEVI